MNIILNTQNITKIYNGLAAVDHLNLQVPQGTIYGLLGPNGAGKSTLLKMITGIVSPTKGNILYKNKPWSRSCLTEIGALIESPPLYGNLTAYENLLVRTTTLGIHKSRIEEVLDIVELKNTEQKKAKQFSMGMKQRLGIALALINSPKLLILDEPTNGLDPFGIRSLRKLIRSFPEKGITVIFSSHILSEVFKTVDEIGIISQGKLGYQGELPSNEQALEELFENVAYSIQDNAQNRR